MAKSHASAAELRRVQRLLALLSHSTRLVIYQRLARTPATAGELSDHLPISRTGIVQHLKLLEKAGLVSASACGRRRVYRCQPEFLQPLARWLERHLQMT
jgi:predicted transcriptional regulator